MLGYRVKLSKDTNGTILVDVPDVPEAHTFGEDRDGALMRAPDVIETPLMGYIENRKDIPARSAKLRNAIYSSADAGGAEGDTEACGISPDFIGRRTSS